MNSTATKTVNYQPARNVSPDILPWVPLGPGKDFKPLRFFSDNRGFTEILRIQPGTVIPLHRHTGEIHAYNLQGTRKLCTGELIGPGEYVYELTGNIDSWEVVGDEPCITFVTVGGAVEFLDDNGNVGRSISGSDLKDMYEVYCRENSMDVLDLVD